MANERTERTEAEYELLDVTEWATGLGMNEQRMHMEQVVNDVLAEGVRDGYRLYYDARDGVHLHTPSGLWVWFCLTNGEEDSISVLVIEQDATQK